MKLQNQLPSFEAIYSSSRNSCYLVKASSEQSHVGSQHRSAVATASFATATSTALPTAASFLQQACSTTINIINSAKKQK
jgi:hypothetical protein